MKPSLLAAILLLFSLVSWALGALWILLLAPHFAISSPLNQGGIENEKQEIRTIQASDRINLVSLEGSVTQTVADSAQSIVSIVISKDLVVYRSDPWGFFQQPSGTVRRQVGGGSGFFVKKDGTILTNKHVVSDPNAQYTVILSDGSEYPAKVLGLDPVNDLAVIKIEATKTQKEFIPLPIVADTQEVHIGQFVIAVGNALAEFQNSVALGIVSGKDRSIEAEGTQLTGLLQTDAAINPGNSGGPLLNLSGSVVGINTAIASGGSGVGFAFWLTQNRVDYILKSLAEHGRIKRPFIGINYIPNSPGVAAELGLPVDTGVYVFDEAGSIVAGSSAQKAGVEPGDIILKVGEKEASGELLLHIIQNSLPGDILKLTLLKKSGETKEVSLTLGEY